jgi:hypothetical protein
MKRRRRAYSVDAVVRFFLHYYNIPTKQDIERILKRMDRLEEAVRGAKLVGGKARRRQKSVRAKKQISRGRAKMTATEKVLSVLKRSSKGMDIAGLKAKSGFEDKKIRNIIFRLSKQGTVKRVGRGVYAIR